MSIKGKVIAGVVKLKMRKKMNRLYNDLENPEMSVEEGEAIDVHQVTERLKAINTELNEIDEKLATFCNELNIPTPF